MDFNRKEHWEKIYRSKALKDVSWYQPVPETSLRFLQELGIPKTAKIIDVGGGDSLFVDHLLELGYRNVSVLDISEQAIDRAKERLGERSRLVNWIVSDVATFAPQEQYDFWHDRAVFHFLTQEQDVGNYLEVLGKGLQPEGTLVMGTFSENGPSTCSGIPVKQYSETTLTALMGSLFDKIKCLAVDHKTPFDTIQQFIFCSFRKKQMA
jgi:2-polyprenyl-3-methyl-5-hydroxy-6-metoxy-1,4-benzoquinol methylase